MGLIFVVAPFGSLADATMYTGPWCVNVLKFVAILVACEALGVSLMVWHRRKATGRDNSPAA